VPLTKHFETRGGIVAMRNRARGPGLRDQILPCRKTKVR